ncbi:MAG TPA: hypothetical protein PLZ51_21870, partial [Aggregatilineales bacterium]|nr:hypothetical protein [Aggregatilineales bacterium]
MTTLTIEISDETFTQLKALADNAQNSLDGFLNNLFIACLNDEEDDAPTNEEILESIKQGLIEALRGDVGRPVR